jgi:hypothetical protein
VAFKNITSTTVKALIEALVPRFLGRDQDHLLAFGDELVGVAYGLAHDYVQPLYDFRATILSPAGASIVGTSDSSNVQAKIDALTASSLPAGGTGTQYLKGPGTWATLNTAAVPELTNLYFTNARAQAAITGGASTIVTSNLTASRALVSDAGGKVVISAVTAAEVGTLSGVTSAIQTQLNAKAPTASPIFTGTIQDQGSSAGYLWEHRDNSAKQNMWYSTADTAILWSNGIGDILQVTNSTGAVRFFNNITLPAGTRIFGDFTNGTQSLRTAFQTSTTNGATVVAAVPNGASTTSSWRAFGGTDPSNANYISIIHDGSTAIVDSNANGTGVVRTLSLRIGGVERIGISNSATAVQGSLSATSTISTSSGGISSAQGNVTVVNSNSSGDGAAVDITSTGKTGSAISSYKLWNLGAPGYTAGLTVYAYPASGGLVSRFRIRDDGGFDFMGSGGGTLGTMSGNGNFDWLTSDGTYSANFSGRVRSRGAAAAFNLEQRDGASGGECGMYAVANLWRVNFAGIGDVLSVSTAGTLSCSAVSCGPVNALGAVTSTGGSAAYYFVDRSTSRQWAWYGQSDTATLYNGSGNIFTISPAGAVTASGGFQTGSSLKLKDIEGNSPYGLAEIEKLIPIIGKYKDAYNPDGRKRLFLGAEPTKEVIPEVVFDEGVEFEGEKVPSLDYIQLVPVLIKAVQELSAKVKELENDRRLS